MFRQPIHRNWQRGKSQNNQNKRIFTVVYFRSRKVSTPKYTDNLQFELNCSSKLRGNNGRENTLVAQVVCFQMLNSRPQLRSRNQLKYFREKLLLSQKLQYRCLISRLQNRILRSRNQMRGKLLLSRKLRYFRGSRFPQWFILSTFLHCSLPGQFVC